LDEGLPLHPLQAQRDVVAAYRQIGIGVFGWAEMLIYLGIRYGSIDSTLLANKIARCLINQAACASAYLAWDKGPYPYYHKDAVANSEFYQFALDTNTKKLISHYGLRNSTLLAIAPTGSLSSLLGGVSGGIEPIFARSYMRRTESLYGEPTEFKIYTPIVQEIMDIEFIDGEDDLPDYVVTSGDIDPLERVNVQAAWQYYIDSSISSTVNLPESATTEDIEHIYLSAWAKGLKGITIFRDNCARLGILTKEEKPKEPDYVVGDLYGLPVAISKSAYPSGEISIPFTADMTAMPGTFIAPISTLTDDNWDDLEEEDFWPHKPRPLDRGEWKKIADDTLYHKIKITSACGKLNIFLGWSETEQNIQEIWVKMRGKGGCHKSIDAIVISLSAILRLGGSISNIDQAFEGLEACNAFVKARTNGRELSNGSSCADAILKAIEQFYKDHKKPEEHKPSIWEQPDVIRQIKDIVVQEKIREMNSVRCPDCNATLIPSGGCFSCQNCGYAKCG
jgi:ribonucleoside-diphosphate reductase alpha chain